MVRWAIRDQLRPPGGGHRKTTHHQCAKVCRLFFSESWRTLHKRSDVKTRLLFGWSVNAATALVQEGLHSSTSRLGVGWGVQKRDTHLNTIKKRKKRKGKDAWQLETALNKQKQMEENSCRWVDVILRSGVFLFLFFFFSPSKKPNQSGSDPPPVLRGVWLHAKTEARVPTSPPPPPPPLLPPLPRSAQCVCTHGALLPLGTHTARSLAAAPRRVDARQTERRRWSGCSGLLSGLGAHFSHESSPNGTVLAALHAHLFSSKGRKEIRLARNRFQSRREYFLKCHFLHLG